MRSRIARFLTLELVVLILFLMVVGESISVNKSDVTTLNTRNAKTASSLADKISGWQNNEPIRVLIKLKSCAGRKWSGENGVHKLCYFRYLRRNMQESRRIVERKLNCLGGWSDLQKSRIPYSYMHDVRNIKSYWIANTVAASVLPCELGELLSDPDIQGIEENTILIVPPLKLDTSTGQDDAPYPWNLSRIGVDLVRELGLDGEGVRIGHLDTGLDPTHPELSGKISVWAEFDFDGNKVESEPHETHSKGHGTHTASILVGDSVGVAPGASLISALVLPGGIGTLEEVLAGMEWILDPDNNPYTNDGAQIVNMSWGTPGTSEILRDAIQNMVAAGVLPVCAIGNTGLLLTYSPGNTPEAMGVGATDENDNVASFSGGGAACWGTGCISKPDITAPGVEISGAGLSGSYQVLSGTSLAAPHVAGCAALLLQEEPSLAPYQLESFLYNTSKDLGNEGFDERYGNGRVDIVEAVNFLGAYKPRLRSADLVLSKTTNPYSYPMLACKIYYSDGVSQFLEEESQVIDIIASSYQNTIEVIGLGDVDGNGYSDIIVAEKEPLGIYAYHLSYKVCLSSLRGNITYDSTPWFTKFLYTSDEPEIVGIADLNGDKLADVLLCQRIKLQSAESFRFSPLLSNGTNSFKESSTDWYTFYEAENTIDFMGVGDVNGDGKGDLVIRKHESSGSLTSLYFLVAISDGSRFRPMSGWLNLTSPFSDSLTGNINLADVNGDKRSDLIISGKVDCSGHIPLYVFLSDGFASFKEGKIWARLNVNDGYGIEGFSDVNGDSACDLVLSKCPLYSRQQPYFVWLSNGMNQFCTNNRPWLIAVLDSMLSSYVVEGISNVGIGSWGR